MPSRLEAVNALGVDVGTTHCKAAVYGLEGHRRAFKTAPTPVGCDGDGRPSIDPDKLWRRVAGLTRDVGARAPYAVVGVSGMAEAGLLVDRDTGEPRSEIIPWYDPRSAPQAESLLEVVPPADGYRGSGLFPSFKYGLSKILWLRERDPGAVRGAVWLSVPDYIVYRMTGQMSTDPTLAARTYAYVIPDGTWNESLLERVHLNPALFPPVLPSGSPVGGAVGEGVEAAGLRRGIEVSVSGHDHLCAMAGVGITDVGPVLDSMGTAESLMGMMTRWEEAAFDSGLTVAPSVIAGRYCWLGGLSASGGSVEWVRSQLADPALAYEDLVRLAVEAGPEPTGILYFPYLSGSGAPHHDPNVRAAFVGLSAQHGRGHLIRAVLEGTAYETLSILRAAEALTETTLTDVVTVGGGTRNGAWLRIKADVSGMRCLVPNDEEAAVRGAAFTAAMGAGLLNPDSLPGVGPVDAIVPHADRHRRYVELYKKDFLPLQAPLRALPGARDATAGLAHA